MKKSFFKVTYSVFCITVLLSTLFSCDVYTHSLAKNLARDQSEVLKNLSTSALADMAADIESANIETAVAIMEMLSNKKEELQNLSINRQEAILNLALDTTIPIGELTRIAEPLIDGGSVSDDVAKDTVKEILENTTSFNTIALTILLEDKNTMQNADPETLANAAFASIAQVANRIPNGVDSFTSDDLNINFESDSPQYIVDALLGANKDYMATTEDNKELLAAITVVKLLQDPTGSKTEGGNGSGLTRTDIVAENVKVLGLISLDQILSGLGG